MPRKVWRFIGMFIAPTRKFDRNFSLGKNVFLPRFPWIFRWIDDIGLWNEHLQFVHFELVTTMIHLIDAEKFDPFVGLFAYRDIYKGYMIYCITYIRRKSTEIRLNGKSTSAFVKDLALVSNQVQLQSTTLNWVPCLSDYSIIRNIRISRAIYTRSVDFGCIGLNGVID